MTTIQIIALARKHLDNGAPMASSARLCVDDALWLASRGDDCFARTRALSSLGYSVGVFHPDYRAAEAAVKQHERAAS